MKRDDCATYIKNKQYLFQEKPLTNKYIYELINLIEVVLRERC